MADSKTETEKQPKVVPPRAPLKRVELRRNSRANELSGRRPGFTYQSFSTEPDHPSYIGKKITEHEIGDQSVGFATVAAWQVCQSATNETVRQLDPRTDQGAKVDTTVRYGRQITCMLPDEEFAKYEAVDAARRELRKKSLFGSPDRLRQKGAAVTTVTVAGEDSEYMDELIAAGHPMPATNRI